MDKKYIEENEIGIKYLRNQLSDKELEEFEVYLTENPGLIETLELEAALGGVKQAKASSSTQNSSKSLFFRAFAWLRAPIPVYAVFAAVALVAPMIASQYSGQPSGQLELVAFSSSTTRGESQNTSNDFDVVTNLSALSDNAAIMIKVTPDVKESYLLEIYDSSKPESKPIWQSLPFEVKSGTRDQIVVLPNPVRAVNARIRVLGKESDGDFSAVRFCHYSENCL